MTDKEREKLMALKKPLAPCLKCSFFRPTDEDKDGVQWGQCRRYPPQLKTLIKVQDTLQTKTGYAAADWDYPLMREDEGCGEFEIMAGI